MPKRRAVRSSRSLPFLAADLALSSWEVIARRSLLMAQNRCTQREYRRMVREKVQAAQLSAATFMLSGGRASAAVLLAPWHGRVKANAKRLRRR